MAMRLLQAKHLLRRTTTSLLRLLRLLLTIITLLRRTRASRHRLFLQQIIILLPQITKCLRRHLLEDKVEILLQIEASEVSS